MLKELGHQMIVTILESLRCVNEDGLPDRKLRLAAFNSAHKFLVDFLPNLSEDDKRQLAKGMSEVIAAQLARDAEDTVRINDLPDISSKQ